MATETVSEVQQPEAKDEVHLFNFSPYMIN